MDKERPSKGERKPEPEYRFDDRGSRIFLTGMGG